MSQVNTIRLPKFSPEDIGAIIGPRGQSMKTEVVSKVWASYNLYKDAEKITVDDPRTPFIKIEKDEEGVFATITSDSEVMVKFAKMHLNKYQDSFKKPSQRTTVSKKFFSLYAALRHDKVPVLIGRGGSTINAIKSEAICQMDDSVEPRDLALCEKSYLKVSSFNPRDQDDFFKAVESSDKASFVGWAPDQGEELVKISVTSLPENESFIDFVECLNGVISTHINEINERQAQLDSSKEEELRDCYEALDADIN